MDEAGDREDEEDDGGDVADPGGLAGTLAEDAETVGGQQRATERLGPQDACRLASDCSLSATACFSAMTSSDSPASLALVTSSLAAVIGPLMVA